MRFLAFIFTLVILCGTNVSAQETQCPLRLEVLENGGRTKIENAEAVIVNLKTRDKTNAKILDGMPYVANLVEGDYSVTVKKEDYKSTVKRIHHGCPTVKDSKEVSQNVWMWSGKPKEKIHFIDAAYDRRFFKDLKINDLALKLPAPDYPTAARAVRASGSVLVLVEIDKDGNVVSAERVSGHPLLAGPAIAAAKKAKFIPSMSESGPVRVTGVIVYNFVLR